MTEVRAPAPPSRLDRLAARLVAPRDAAALAVFRFLFGALGFVSALRFQAYGWVDELFVEPRFFFHYWGAGWAPPPGREGAHALFVALTLVSACVALGLFYRAAIVLFFLGFTYVQLIDVTNYLNHYYLVSLLALLMALMPLHGAWSLDALLFPRIRRATLPAWCAYLLRFQVAIVYTFAGIAKLSQDWLVHAQPLTIWLSARTGTPVIGLLFAAPWAAHAMSWAGCLFDLTIAGWLLLPRTRPVAYATVIAFHALTWALFPIGMFPAIMVVGATVFFSPSWPRRLLPRWLSAPAPPAPPTAPAPSRWLRPALAAAGAYAVLQLLLPLRAHRYEGNVHWHEQGMRFSWRVMVREKNASVTYRVTSPATGRVVEVNPRDYLTARQEREFAAQPDLILQLAHRIADDVSAREGARPVIQVDAIASLNGRLSARLIDPEVDLARVPDSLSPAAWILPAPSDPPLRLRPIAWKLASYPDSR